MEERERRRRARRWPAACREAGLAFGVYVSPWDRHEPSYGDSPRYNELFRAQLRELLTGYGEIAEVWFDGAMGEGPNGKRQVYDWPSYYRVVRELQPEARSSSGWRPDVRWVGTESGYGRETEWSVVPLTLRDGAAPRRESPHPLDDAFVPGDLTAKDLGSREAIRHGQRARVVPGRDGRVDQAGLVLPCEAGRPGQDAGEAGRHLLQLGRAQRRCCC